LSNYGFSLKPKHAARNKTDINLVAVNSLYLCTFILRVPQRDAIDKVNISLFEHIPTDTIFGNILYMMDKSHTSPHMQAAQLTFPSRNLFN